MQNTPLASCDELVLYGIRELAPAIPRTSPRHRGGPVCLRLNVILVIISLAWYLDSIALGNNADVTLDVSFTASCRVIRVG